MKKRASHWGAARQEDAHEFFTALLNALADEVQQAQVSLGLGVANTPGACGTAGCVGRCSLLHVAAPTVH